MKGENVFRVLAFGDVIGDSGKTALFSVLRKMREQMQSDLVVLNGENAFQGFGITQPVAELYFDNGVDVITSGNHVWQKKEVFQFIDRFPPLLRPLNYPPNTPGHGSVVLERSGLKVGVINLMGRIYMEPIECPFQSALSEIERMKEAGVSIILVDFHAEATSEKELLGWTLDGLASAVWGTHTHVQTADETVLPQKTAYITDLGMCGCSHSVIGMKIEQSTRKLIKHLPVRFSPAEEGPLQVNGAVIDIQKSTGEAILITRINEKIK